MTLLMLGGCASLAFYGQSLSGHLSLLQQARPLQDWLDQPGLDPQLREQLLLARRLRDFASRELALPDNASYRRYAQLGREAVVWNVVAAPALSLQLKTWCYPVAGCAGYRGYFDRAAAQAQARQLQQQGWETYVYGVPAYSTLGWSNWLGGDPLLDTFVREGEAALARLIFHELAHQVAYAPDDMDFNEGYASAVERLGLQAWRRRQAPQPSEAEQAQRQDQLQTRRRQLQVLVQRTRAGLQQLYGSPLDPARQQAGKAALMAELQRDYAALRDGDWGGDARWDAWVAGLNNAALALQASYTDLVPQFERLFQRLDGDWPRFHAEVRRLASLPQAQRRLELGPN
jgi:predicted aminopeptidase